MLTATTTPSSVGVTVNSIRVVRPGDRSSPGNALAHRNATYDIGRTSTTSTGKRPHFCDSRTATAPGVQSAVAGSSVGTHQPGSVTSSQTRSRGAVMVMLRSIVSCM